MMQAQANPVEGDIGDDRAAMEEALGSIRQELHSVVSDMRDVLQENEELNEELSRLRRHRRGAPSDAQRLKQECVDGLERLQEIASFARGRRRRQAPDDTSLLKKMMMFMMIAELV